MEVRVPELAESITEATIVRWIKKIGDRIQQGEVIVELETDKVNLEVHAEQEGVIAEILSSTGATVHVGEVIAILHPAREGEEPAIDPQSSGKAPLSGKKSEQDIPVYDSSSIVASPAARRLARDKGISLQQVQGKDPLGRIYIDDVKAVQESGGQAAPQAEQMTMPLISSKPIKRIQMTKRRQTIAAHLVHAQQTAAMLTTFNEVDMQAIMNLRKRKGEAFQQQHQVKLGYMSFFTKAVVRALKAYPMLNAEIQGQEIVVKKYYDIGIAVAAKEGLVVPVVREADRLSFAELEQQIADLAEKARENQLHLAELQGGTFTITNGGTFGSLLSTPILNAPQVGILGMHKIQWRPIALDEQRMENRPMMFIALSYDHRIIDGKEAVGFLVKIKELLEDPEALLLEG